MFKTKSLFHLPSKYWIGFWCGTFNVKVTVDGVFNTTNRQDLHQAYVQGLWQGGNLAEGIWDDTYGPGLGMPRKVMGKDGSWDVSKMAANDFRDQNKWMTHINWPEY